MITDDQLKIMQMRVEAGRRVKSPKVEIVDAFEGAESKLHQMIAEDVKKRRWLCFHGVTHKSSGRTAGEPDLTVCAPGKVYFIEVKKKGGKLSQDQTIVRHLLLALEQNYSTCYSFNDYLRAIGEL